MTLSVIGAGFGRTGTLSLKIALEQLGFGPCYHMLEVFEKPEHVELWAQAATTGSTDWEKLLGAYASGVDWPVSAFYGELSDLYPRAKVILTIRDAESWFASVTKTIFSARTQQRLNTIFAGPHIGPMMNKLYDGTFDGRLGDEAHMKAVFERHIKEVRAAIPAERLLVYEVKEGWEPLCRFLEVGVPDGDFPRVNTTKEFLEKEGARTLT